MHRIDGPSATPEHLFTEGSPTGGVPATIVTDDWLNDVQENVCRAIEGMGITLVKGDFTQLLAAILGAAGALLPKRGFGVNDYIRIPDVPGGFILQWCSVPNPATAGTSATVTWPINFPFACRSVAMAPDFVGGGAVSMTLTVINRTQTGALLHKAAQSGTPSVESATTIFALGN